MSKHLDKRKEEEDELFPPPRLDYYINYSNVVIIDNVPVIPKEKSDKLTSVLRKILSQFGTLEDMFLPFEPGGQKSCGFVFVEYSKAEEARLAQEKLMNYRLDKSHVFVTNMYEDFETYDKMPLEPRPIEDIKYEKPENLYDWLLDPYGCDQFVLHYGDETEIMWNGAQGIPTRSVSKEPKTELPIQWSPLGTYLVTFHHLGIILWGGPKWKKLRKIRHNGVDIVDFSPNENYLVTNSPTYLEQDNPSDPQAIIIWDVKTGQKLRGFQRMYPKIWPEFQWSHNDKYFSRISKGLISVYETPSMMLLESNSKKSIKLHAQAKDHAWSPKDNYLCVYVPENLDIPARIVLMEIPTLAIIGQQNIFNVVDCRLLWQDWGDYLAVKVDRHAKKSKKKTFTSFEFFRIREKNVPVEPLKLEDTVIAFSWEPKGKRFAMIHSDAENRSRPNVSFYSMGSEGSAVRKLDTLEKRQATHLSWSPRGRFIIIFSPSGNFEFYDAENLETMAKDRQHQMVTNVDWDPTGRYVTTYVSYYKSKSENGYKIWSFRGTELTSVLKDGFLQFIWRPRPPSLLTEEQIKMLENPEFFKKKRAEYKEEDRKKAEELHIEREKEKERIRERFREFMGRKKAEYEADLAYRKNLGMEEDEGYLVEEMVEEVLEVKEEMED